MWDMNSQKSGGASSQGFVEEGNIKVFLFNETPTRVRFLTENVDIEKIMEEQKIAREQAIEYVNTELLFNKWVMPIAFWEHTIPGIQGQRYFSTVTCAGKKTCKLCFENDAAKNRGISENKLLPYPVRKRFYVPAYFYEMDKVLFVKQNQEFFEDIANYINKNDGPVDFEIYRTGKGFETKYKVMFIGPVQKAEIPEIGIAPKDLDLKPSDEELDKKVATHGFDRDDADTTPVATDSDNPGDFKIPFGSHKGKTIGELYAVDPEYITFLATNSSGLLQDKIKAFIG